MYTAAPPWRSSSSTTVSNHNAYIPVTTHRPFAQMPPPTYHPQPYQQPSPLPPHQVPTQAGANPVKKKVDWPRPVREYVQRSFSADSMIKGVTREEMEARLKKVITDAAESGNLNNVNWAELPLPQQMIQEERNRAILVSPAPPSPWTPAPAPVSVHGQVPPQVEVLRKRKSAELSTETEEEVVRPPWRSTNQPTLLEDRISHPAVPEKRQRLDQSGKNVSKSHVSLENRKKRFEDPRSGIASPVNGAFSRGNSPSVFEDSGPIVGRSTKLEKNYFRLTSAPNPDTVRPLEVLKKTLDLLKRKWREENNYSYICDQFKSLRQDLTVQHIKTEFTVNVYEIHARIALEKGDLGEYNQCQTQLRALYKEKLGGHPTEFRAYRILYFIHTCNRTDMNDVLSELTPADKAEHPIKHALDVRSALALGNYHRFFQLYLDTPNMGAYLMDMFVARERLAALASICRAYKPDVKIRFVTEELGFESDEESARFILEYASGEILQERDDGVRLFTGKAGQTFENAKAQAFKHVDIKGQI